MIVMFAVRFAGVHKHHCCLTTVLCPDWRFFKTLFYLLECLVFDCYNVDTKTVFLITEIILIAMIFRQRKADFRLVSGKREQRWELPSGGANIQFQTLSFATFASPTTVEVVLVLLVILVGLRPFKRLGNHEQEIADILLLVLIARHSS
jgi:hypothetical protein